MILKGSVASVPQNIVKLWMTLAISKTCIMPKKPIIIHVCIIHLYLHPHPTYSCIVLFVVGLQLHNKYWHPCRILCMDTTYNTPPIWWQHHPKKTILGKKVAIRNMTYIVYTMEYKRPKIACWNRIAKRNTLCKRHHVKYAKPNATLKVSALKLAPIQAGRIINDP